MSLSKTNNQFKATHLLRVWCHWYLNAKGKPYPVFKGKHLKMLSLLRKSYQDDEMLKFLRMHLEDCTEYIKQAGHPLEMLGSQIPRYIQLLNSRKNNTENAKAALDDYQRRRRAALGH